MQRLPIPTLLVVFALATVSAVAQDLRLTFPAAGVRDVYVLPDIPAQAPTDGALRTQEAQTTLKDGGRDPKAIVLVWDRTSNHLASRRVSDIAGGAWTLTAEDFTRLGSGKVRVETSGDPVAAANLVLESGGFRREEILDPSMQGDVPIFGVPIRPLKVTVSYRNREREQVRSTTTFDLQKKRSQVEPTFVVSLPDGMSAEAMVAAGAPEGKGEGSVEGAGPQGKAASADGKAAPEAERPNPIGTALAYLFVLGILGVAGFYALRAFKQNPKVIQEKLEQLGAQVPTDGGGAAAGDPPVALPPQTAVKPQPQKILLDDAAPTPLGDAGAATPVSPVAGSVGEPGLRMESGDLFPLPEGETVVGRDLGLGLSLSTESSVSRRHAAVVRTGNTVVVRDLGSTNGTYVNGQKVDGETALQPGDSLQFGSVRIRFEA